jgi:hypothetical protein
MFCEGNTVLNTQDAGGIGDSFNIASLLVCCVLRARAEGLFYSDPHTGPYLLGTLIPFSPEKRQRLDAFKCALGKMADSPKTSLVAAGVAQFCVAATEICLHGLTPNAIIPLAFAGGNIFSALRGEPLEKIRRGVANSLIGRVAGSLVNKEARSRAIKKAFNYAGKILTAPEIYYTTGLILAGGHIAPAAIFAVAGLWSVAKVLANRAPNKTLLDYSPMLTVAAGSFVAAGQNALGAGHQPHVAVATALFGIGYASIPALDKCGGVVQAAAAVRNKFRSRPLSLSSSPK